MIGNLDNTEDLAVLALLFVTRRKKTKNTKEKRIYEKKKEKQKENFTLYIKN